MLQRARALWGFWWWLPALPWLGYAVAMAAIGAARWEHLAAVVLVVASAYGGERPRRLFLAAIPLLVVFLAYDSLRYWRGQDLAIAGDVGCWLHDAELRLFGVRVDGALLTPNEALARLQHPALDLLCAVPYGGYLAFLTFHFLYLYRTDADAARRLAWIAFGAHALGFLTYRLLPAAPPWYVQTYGCAIHAETKNSVAGLARVDALLGTTYFHDLYSRGATPFGALPSLHVSYPWMGIFATFRRARPWSKALQLGYAGLMFFAAVYLGHHWVLDGLLGIAYATVAAIVVHRALRERRPAEARA